MFTSLVICVSYILCDRSSSIPKKFIESHNQKIPLYYCRYEENWCTVSLIAAFTTGIYSCMVSGEFKRDVAIAPPCLLGNTKVLMYCSVLSNTNPIVISLLYMLNKNTLGVKKVRDQF